MQIVRSAEALAIGDIGLEPGLDLRELRALFQDLARCDGALSLVFALGGLSRRRKSYTWNIGVRDQRTGLECAYVDYATFQSYYPGIGPGAPAASTEDDNPSHHGALRWLDVLRIFDAVVTQYPQWMVSSIYQGSADRYWLILEEHQLINPGQSILVEDYKDFMLAAQIYPLTTYDDWLALHPEAER